MRAAKAEKQAKKQATEKKEKEAVEKEVGPDAGPSTSTVPCSRRARDELRAVLAQRAAARSVPTGSVITVDADGVGHLQP